MLKQKISFVENLRLTAEQLEIISTAFKNVFGSEDELWIFGSRTDLAARGGDIDIFIKTAAPADQVVKLRSKFLTAVFRCLEEQKIDVVIEHEGCHQLIYDIARKTGVRII